MSFFEAKPECLDLILARVTRGEGEALSTPTSRLYRWMRKNPSFLSPSHSSSIETHALLWIDPDSEILIFIDHESTFSEFIFSDLDFSPGTSRFDQTDRDIGDIIFLPFSEASRIKVYLHKYK